MKRVGGVKRSNIELSSEISEEILGDIENIVKRLRESNSIVERVNFNITYIDFEERQRMLIRDFQSSENIEKFGLNDFITVCEYYVNLGEWLTSDWLETFCRNASIILGSDNIDPVTGDEHLDLCQYLNEGLVDSGLPYMMSHTLMNDKDMYYMLERVKED